MTKIIIEVDDQLAQAFQNATPEQRKHLSNAASIVMKKKLNDITFEDYQKFLDSTSKEATQNGLTEEILKELLKND